MAELSLYIAGTAGDGDRSQRAKFAKILVIAGPSGAGKSTFIRAFQEGRLPPKLAPHLPEVARLWPIATDDALALKGLPSPAKGGNAAGGNATSGLIVHRDIMRVVTRGYGGHNDDPAIQKILSAGGALDIVTLAPPRETLLVQFLKRLRDDEGGEWRQSGELARRMKARLRRLRQNLTGRRSEIALSEDHLLLLAIYGSERRFRHWSSCWNGFVAALAEAREDVRLLTVAPDLDEDGAPSFRLCGAEPVEPSQAALLGQHRATA